MKISPVKSYKTPSYPSISQAQKDPGLLKDNLLSGWINGKLVTGALTAYLLCSFKENTDAQIIRKHDVVLDGSHKNGKPQKNTGEVTENKPVYIAPLFQHGEGIGSFGCVVVNPPVYLSEQEAKAIIEEELLKEGIIFDRKNVRIDEVIFNPGQKERDDLSIEGIEPEEIYDNIVVRANSGNNRSKPDTLIVDGYSSAFNLVYEFISTEDYHKLHVDDGFSITVSSVNTVKASERMREELKKYGKLNAVVFYDPMPESSRRWGSFSGSEEDLFNRIEKMIRDEESKFDDPDTKKDQSGYQPYPEPPKDKAFELLRKQVRDFVIWMKKEGYLNNK